MKSLTTKAHQNHFSNICRKMDKPWNLYNLLNRKRRHKAAITLSDQNGNPIIHDPDLNTAQLLDLFFPDDDSSTDSPPHQEVRELVNNFLHTPSDSANIPDISPEEVHSAFLTSKLFSATPNQTPAAFYLWNLDSLALPLSRIYSACIKLAHFPREWKQSSLLTIPKSSSGIDLSSHKSQRPITLLPVMGKIFEKILLQRFLFSKPKGWTNKAQRGFIGGSSTEASLFQLRSRIQTNLRDNYKGVVAISLDIAAAFDKAWHPAILKNLRDKNMPLHLIKLIASFLNNRSTSLDFGSGNAPKLLSRSTPQGSVLSPFLWNIFIDPLLNTLEE